MGIRILGIFGFLFSLSSCASLVEGTDQTVMFKVSPQTAVCDVRQKDKFIGTLQKGGGQLDVSKSRKDIIVDCIAPGYAKQTLALVSSASGWGIAGCLIDFCITDLATGAFNKYKDNVTISLVAANRVPSTMRGAGYPNSISGIGFSEQKPMAARMVTPRTPLSISTEALRANTAVVSGAEGPPVIVEKNSRITSPMIPMHFSALRSQSWRTVHSKIRAYWGPDAERDFFDMPNSVPLSLVARKGQWGLFAYRASNGKNGKVWITLEAVRPAR
ncbi:MAG: hypothetical protein CMM76_04035 [Rhodospirillaceae bacterium]|nr:hypothetical protein [Rhodospirillaceae bacterium]